MPKILKKICPKQGIDLQPFQIFKTMRSVLHCSLGLGYLVDSFQRKKFLGTLKVLNDKHFDDLFADKWPRYRIS